MYCGKYNFQSFKKLLWSTCVSLEDRVVPQVYGQFAKPFGNASCPTAPGHHKAFPTPCQGDLYTQESWPHLEVMWRAHFNEKKTQKQGRIKCVLSP